MKPVGVLFQLMLSLLADLKNLSATYRAVTVDNVLINIHGIFNVEHVLNFDS